jgi:tetratricopeptide (TPR) repeat protein
VDGALKAIENSLTLEGEVATAHELHARVLIEAGRLDAALEAVDRGYELEASSGLDYLRGIVLELMGHLEEARSSYEAALDGDSTNASYRIALAEIQVQLGCVDQARSNLEASNPWNPEQAGIYQALGHLELLEGNHRIAREHFEAASLLRPKDPGVLEDLLRIQVQLGDWERGLETAASLAVTLVQGERPDLRRLHAFLLIRNREPVQAREILLELTTRATHGYDHEAWKLLSEVAVMIRDWRLLRSAGDRMIQREPMLADGFLAQALARREEGDLPGALKSARLALDRQRDSGTANQLMALILAEIERG